MELVFAFMDRHLPIERVLRVGELGLLLIIFGFVVHRGRPPQPYVTTARSNRVRARARETERERERVGVGVGVDARVSAAGEDETRRRKNGEALRTSQRDDLSVDEAQ